MRTLFLSTAETIPWGGSESLWYSVAQQMIQDGHHVAFSYRYWPEEPALLAKLRRSGAVGHYREQKATTSFPVRVVRKLNRKKMNRAYPAFTMDHWFLSLVMDEKPDLVVLNLCDAYMLWYMADVFCMLHEQGIPYYMICQLEDETQLILPGRREALRDLFTKACGVSFGSRFGADLVSRQLASALPNVEIFQNPPNCSGQRLPWPDKKDDTLRMACVGRLDVPAKGQDVILASLAKPAWRDRRWRLSFYGKGPEEDHLRNLAVYYGIADKVIFAGYKSSVDSIWAEEELCLQPSPKEGTPMTVVEAMFAGRPSLVSDIGRMPDLIEGGKTGWICSRGVFSFSRGLDEAWNARENLEYMGQCAHEHISEVWDRNYPLRMASRLVKIVESQL